jgi:hypothetical protein
MPTALPSFYLKTWICVLNYVRHCHSEIHFHSLYTTPINQSSRCVVFTQNKKYFLGFVRMPDDSV